MTTERAGFGQLILERAVTAALASIVMLTAWLFANGWQWHPAMLLVPIFVVLADLFFFGLPRLKWEGLWLCLRLLLATAASFLVLSLVVWMFPDWLSATTAAAIAGGYFIVRLSGMLIA